MPNHCIGNSNKNYEKWQEWILIVNEAEPGACNAMLLRFLLLLKITRSEAIFKVQTKPDLILITKKQRINNINKKY
jgi:hypothetical protein